MTTVNAMHYVQLAVTLAAMWVLICRLNTMSRDTCAVVRHQHAVLFSGLAGSVFSPPQYALLSCAAGVLLFLLLSMHRWRRGAPGDMQSAPTQVCRPKELEPIDWNSICGGKHDHPQ